MATRLNWHGEEFFDKLKREEAKRLERAAIFLKNEVKDALEENSVKREGERVVDRSKPGDVPYLDEGELRRSMAHEVDKTVMKARVGTNKIYGRYLEMGTKKMAARPFLRPELKSNQRKVAAIMAGKKIRINR